MSDLMNVKVGDVVAIYRPTSSFSQLPTAHSRCIVRRVTKTQFEVGTTMYYKETGREVGAAKNYYRETASMWTAEHDEQVRVRKLALEHHHRIAAIRDSELRWLSPAAVKEVYDLLAKITLETAFGPFEAGV